MIPLLPAGEVFQDDPFCERTEQVGSTGIDYLYQMSLYLCKYNNKITARQGGRAVWMHLYYKYMRRRRDEEAKGAR